MSAIDYLIPTYYQITELSIAKQGNNVIAQYAVAIFNADGRRLDTIYPASALTAQEKTALLAIMQRDKDQFETNTGLTELPPEPPPP
jgi:hypothetical protein